MLGRLSDIYGVTGSEGRVRKFIKDAIAPYVDDMHTDALGNLIAHKAGRGPKVLLAAHMDEVGMIVRGARDDGLLAIACRSIDARVLVSKRVAVGPDDVPGVIGAKAIHLQTDDEYRRALKYDQLFIDIGARDKADALKYVSVGDAACFTTRFESFGEGLMRGKALDDRVGCAAIIELLKGKYDCDLYAALTVQEEAGLRGAAAAAFAVQSRVALIFEGTTANDVPESLGHQWVTRVGQGAAISFMDARTITRRNMVDALVSSAAQAGAKYQMRQGNAGGTDAGAIHLTAAGCVTGGISVPCRYIHSPCCVASWQDYKDVVKTGRAFLESGKFNEVI